MFILQEGEQIISARIGSTGTYDPNYGSNTYELFISSENGDISKYVFGPDGGKLEGTALSHSGVYEQEARIGSDLNDDGVVGPSIISVAFDKRDATNGNQSYNHRNTNAYNTTQGLILDPYHDGTFDDDFSRTSLDLRNTILL